MVKALVLMFAAIAVSGCTKTEYIYVDRPIEVLVEVPVKAEPPEKLLKSPDKNPPDFSEINGLVCAPVAGLSEWLFELSKREKAWRAWARKGP